VFIIEEKYPMYADLNEIDNEINIESTRDLIKS